MKLDSLIDIDNSAFNTNEWFCELLIGPMGGGTPCHLANYQVNSFGNVWLQWVYTALVDIAFTGYEVTRVWRADDGTIKRRNTRNDVWSPAKTISKGATVVIEMTLEPGDWT